MTTQTVEQDSTMRALHSELIALNERQAVLQARQVVLARVGAHQFNAAIPLLPGTLDLSPSVARQELRAIETELASLDRRVDAVHARMLVADVRAQTSIVEAEMPTYRQLVQARDQAKAILDNRESAIRAFLLDLRRRGCFQTPPTAERGWSH